MNERVRVGVIGAGAIGYRHCETLAYRVPEAEIAAVADTDEAAAKRAADLDPAAVATTDRRAILDDPSIRAVVIATPNDTHAQLVEEAAAAGKHVFCEKPLGLDLESIDDALEAAKRRSVNVQVGFQRRFDPAYREARRMIAEGEIGDVELIVGTTRDPSPPSAEYFERSGSFFADTAIHDYDSIRFLTGLEVAEVYATASRMFLPDEGGDELLDTAVTTLRLETGALAVVTNSRRAVHGYEVGIEVMGSSGKVAVGQERETLLRRYGPQGVSHDHVRHFWKRFEEGYVQEIADFVRCVADDREPESSGRDGRAALEIAINAARSLREGTPVAFRPN